MRRGVLAIELRLTNWLLLVLLDRCRQRSAVVDAQIVRLALERGLKEGEIAAAQANCKAVGMIFAPWVYSAMYTAFRETRHPGAPYFLCIALLGLGQLLTACAGAAAMGDAQPERRK